ncbi:hypothetical protein EJB05_49138, partial [Eragrostis curvula]
MTSTAAPSTSPLRETEEMIPEVRVSMPAAAGADDDKELAASPHPTLLWRALRFLALRVADAVVYAMCAALCLVSVGSMLCVLGPRIGGGAGARAIDAGNLLATAGAYLFPSGLVAMPLMVTAQVARLPDKEPDPRRESNKGTSTLLRAMWGFLLSDPVISLLIFYFLVGFGLLPELFSLEKGSFWEQAGSLLLVTGAVGAALMNCCLVCPKWARDWRAGQQSRANKRN